MKPTAECEDGGANCRDMSKLAIKDFVPGSVHDTSDQVMVVFNALKVLISKYFPRRRRIQNTGC